MHVNLLIQRSRIDYRIYLFKCETLAIYIYQYKQKEVMGGCQSASDNVEAPKQATLPTQNKFKTLEKSKLSPPQNIHNKIQLLTSNGKITDYIVKNTACPIKLAYQELDIGNSLDGDNKYRDSSFGNNMEDIGSKFPEVIEWRRPEKFMKGGYRIFQGKVQPKDIKQGKLGDCYLLSSLAALSEYPFIVKRIFETTEQSSYGAYGVWLFIDGFWRCVIIDDYFPTSNGKPIFSRNNENQLWVMLIEKAYAKVFGSYENIESGLTGMAMMAITGAPYEYICKDSNHSIDINTAWEFIATHTALNHLITGSTENNDRNGHLGLVSTHAYTILDCQEVYTMSKKGKKKEKILKLSNPWGRYEWKGRWSQVSDVWNEQLKKQLNYEQADDGIFWIGLDDFLQNFGQICACKFNKNYINNTIALQFSQAENDFKCAYLTVNNRTEGYINLIQKDHRFHPQSTYKYSLVRMIILQIDKATKTLSKYITDIMDSDHDASVYVELDPGDYYIIVEVDWNSDFTRTMALNFYGQHPVVLVEDTKPPNIQQLFNEIVILHGKCTELERVYEYEKDMNIKRVTGSIAGYVYYHYNNKSKNNNYLCETVTLKEKKYIQVDGQDQPDQFTIKVYPDEERIVKLKVQKEGNSFYSFSTKIMFYIVEKYTLEKLRELADKKPTKVKKREIESKEIDVVIKTYNYSGGIVMLYQNKMDKYAYVEQIKFQIENLQLQNEQMPRNNKLEIQLEPQSQKMLSFLVNKPGKEVIFRTQISFYLNAPEFKF